MKFTTKVSPMLENCADNLASWKKLSEERKKNVK